jgi:hypothetical protein
MRDQLRAKERELSSLEAQAELKASVGAPDAAAAQSTASSKRAALTADLQRVGGGASGPGFVALCACAPTEPESFGCFLCLPCPGPF